VVSFTTTNTVTATGLDTCQARTVVARAGCLGGVARSLVAVLGTPTLNADGSLNLSFLTENGKWYTVQVKSALTDPAWTALPGMPISGSGGILILKDPTAAHQPLRFYRIMSTP
jgi:hypothetical protein